MWGKDSNKAVQAFRLLVVLYEARSRREYAR